MANSNQKSRSSGNPKASSSRNTSSSSRKTSSSALGKRSAGRPSSAELANEFKNVTSLPDPPAGSDGLTERQRLILQVIQDSVDERGYPPSVREMGQAVGLASSASVSYQLKELERKGFIRRDPRRPRAIDICVPLNSEQTSETQLRPLPDITDIGDAFPTPVNIPVVGQIAAGSPILAEEHVETVLPLPKELVGEGTLFILEVHGDSMVDAAICDGDYVVIRQQPTANNGEIVAALIDDEATVKTLKVEPEQVWLLPQNPVYEPIDGNDATILGKVVAVLRRV